MAYYTYQLNGLHGKTPSTPSAPTGGSSGGWSASDWSSFVGAMGTATGTIIDAARGESDSPPNWNQEPTIGQSGETPETGASAASTMTPPPTSSMPTIPWYVYAGGGLLALLVLSTVLRPRS
jgi:hypothetical protein